MGQVSILLQSAHGSGQGTGRDTVAMCSLDQRCVDKGKNMGLVATHWTPLCLPPGLSELHPAHWRQTWYCAPEKLIMDLRSLVSGLINTVITKKTVSRDTK